MKLNIHTLKPARGSNKKGKVVGRGNASGHGTSATRGGKGQTARSGGAHRLRQKAFRRLMQSTPKLRGFNSLEVKPETLTFETLEKKFQNGDKVNIASLMEKNLIKDTVKNVKIVNTGKLTKKLVFEGIKFTSTAAEIVKNLGGEIK
ncbi:MAG TPA: 50S ribosomal protein L15 [Candidatus Magasanikbacteria bacterium]|nr:50S ribosomal protein L15 [Candidatus Magasanikbacteria bacterium]